MTDGASEDPQAFLRGLVDGTLRALPNAVTSRALTVEHDRSMADRLAGRPGTVRAITLATPDEALSLRLEPGPRWKGEAARTSGGIIIARRALPLGQWLTEFAGRVAVIAADEAGDAAATSTALRALGIKQSAGDVLVHEESIENDLRVLPGRLASRLPADALASVGSIVEALLDALSRVAGNVEAELVLRRVATIYLPDTLDAYLALPADWALSHTFRDGGTPATALTAQLAELSTAVTKLREAALDKDATALLNNGRFLATRFGASALDLQ